jgi:hypothetical protein
MGETHFGNFAREAGLLGSPVAKCRMRRLTVPSKLVNTGLPPISAQAGQPRYAPRDAGFEIEIFVELGNVRLQLGSRANTAAVTWPL